MRRKDSFPQGHVVATLEIQNTPSRRDWERTSGMVTNSRTKCNGGKRTLQGLVVCLYHFVCDPMGQRDIN